MARARTDEVVNVTSAPQSRAEELAGRQRKYLLSMSLRVVCFLGAILVGHGWLLYVLIGAALVLPYIAVVAANAVTAPAPAGAVESPGVERRHLTGGS
ncbi:hypothetical protein GCM10011519_04250 [Marmoricola endophyticus]|uniref:DUF3099 domain-containing protein n=1 Tax=Marmoricola endophyticus TaxID=2040280 RepID=A0A917BBU8_9ACTN|nr:DUF3099 domain-containing protein [Marmoricola endophyticus]GGF33930.1 hypothetical protein GCM10011519_04250 [Marmoricola endophyticus]